MPELPNSVAYFATRLLSHNAVTRRMVPPLRLTDRAPWPCPPKPVAPSSIPQTVLFRSAPLRPSPVFPKPAPVDNADSDPSDSTPPTFAARPRPPSIAPPNARALPRSYHTSEFPPSNSVPRCRNVSAASYFPLASSECPNAHTTVGLSPERFNSSLYSLIASSLRPRL